MDEKDATETAYKNGYEDGKRDAVKHGRWIEVDDGVLIGKGTHFECSECEVWESWGRLSRYCPNCGARMDGDGNA